MIHAKSINKYYDTYGVITEYTLRDLNGRTVRISSDNLKTAIRKKKINVINLTLTSDNRLVEAALDKYCGQTFNEYCGMYGAKSVK